MRNTTTARRLVNVFVVDDGATHSSIKQSDVGKTTRLYRPIPSVHTFGGRVLRNVPTFIKFITIDGLRTRCYCTVDERVIGLDVIHRYIHKIDYRKANPRKWRRRPDLQDENTDDDDNDDNDDDDDD